MAKLIKTIYDQINLATNKGLTGYHSDTQIMDVIDNAQMGLFRPLLKEFAKTKQIRNELLPFQIRSSVVITSKIGSLPDTFEHEIDAWVTVSSVDYPITFLEAGQFRERLRDPIDTPSTTNLIANIYFDSAKKIELSNDITPVVLNYFKRPAKPVFVTVLTHTFTVTSANATAGATYTNNGQTFTVVTTISGGTTLVCTSPGSPASSGTLTKASGTGDATITFSSVSSTSQYVYSDSESTDVEWSALVHDVLVERSLGLLGLNMKDGQIQRAGQSPIPKEASIK
jgi:hypothetical protein